MSEAPTDDTTATDSAAGAEVADGRFADRRPVLTPDQHRRRSRRAFLTWGLAGAAGLAGHRWVGSRPERDNLPDVIRGGLELNDTVWSAVGRAGATDRTYRISDREDLRVNGTIGLDQPLDRDSWRVRVLGPSGELIDMVDLATVQELGPVDRVWEHRCIEGWASIAHWTGAPLADLVARYHRAIPDDAAYVALRTPDDAYYVGLHRETALHPQTLLAWALNGEPLTEAHGAPLRLALPTTYGIKQLKRVGTVQFTRQRPPDYWAERGYDWHARF